jgi:hypothetical protein
LEDEVAEAVEDGPTAVELDAMQRRDSVHCHDAGAGVDLLVRPHPHPLRWHESIGMALLHHCREVVVEDGCGATRSYIQRVVLLR